MAPPFIALNVQEFRQLLHAWQPRRGIDEIHMHHTWEPNHAQFRGHDSIVDMWRYHTQDKGWSDIAQHLTIDPQGTIWTGRHWDQPPASSTGRNGSLTRGPFMFELVGNFDEGRDPFQGAQRDAALWVIGLVQERFKLPPDSLKFHRDLGSPKTCPGTGIDYDEVLEAVKELAVSEVPKSRQKSARIAGYDPVLRARQWLSETPPRPTDRENAEPSDRASTGRSLNSSEGTRAARAPKLDQPTLRRLRPHVINLANGMLSGGGEFQTDEGDVRRIFEEELPRRVKRLGNGEKLPIVLYAHGGLVDESSGLLIAAAQTPWWIENGTYPIAFVWETGLWETLGRMIGIGGRALAQRGDTSDAIVEGIVRLANGKSIWQAMKFSAAHAFEAGGGGTIVLEHMQKFLATSGDKVRFHAVGHSAGSIFHSYLLPKLLALNGTTVDSLSLLAPAITVADFKARLVPHVGSRIRRLAMFTMGKDAELADTVTSLYGKSLLYLINRALEPRVGEPILGLEESVRADDAMRKLFGLGAPAAKGVVVWSPTDLATGRHASRSLRHGDFDNDAPTMESVAREVLDLPDAAPVTPFPVDQVPRQARLQAPPAGSSAEAALVQASVMADVAPAAEAALVRPPVISGAGGRRLSLCVGIDDYPNPADRLGGCVADARDWERAFAGLGFQVATLLNGAATRQQIMQRLSDLIGGASAGDTIALQFAAHGTQLEDTDGDEDDDKDEAFCPVDYAQGHFIVDDDFRVLFAGLKPGVALTCFFDTCHSGTITRLGVGRAAPPPVARARFIRATADMNRAHREDRKARAAPASAGRAAMRHVVFAACKPDETALESDGRGHFSLRAVPLLANAAGRISNQRFSELVTAAFGARPQQNPNLDCADGSQDAAFLLSGGSAGAGRGLLAGLNGAGRGNGAHRADDVVALLELVARLSH